MNKHKSPKKPTKPPKDSRTPKVAYTERWLELTVGNAVQYTNLDQLDPQEESHGTNPH